MQKKLKLCNGCDQDKVIWKNYNGNKYCSSCWARLKLELTNEPKLTVARQPIARVSDKRSKEERIYSGRRIIFLAGNPSCQANIPGICLRKSCEVHHKKGRVGKLFLDERFWLATCRKCHEWIEANPEKAKLLGLSLSRLENNEQENEIKKDSTM